MDCGSCERILTQVVRRGRPKRLLDAIVKGSSEDKAGGDAGVDKSDVGARPSRQRQRYLDKLECRVCPSEGPASGARAFLEAPPTTVVLCANRLGSRREVEEAVVHELVHAYDFLVAGRDLTDCRTLAYSEVRAARAAECSDETRSFLWNYFRKGCVKTMATRSTEVRCFRV